MTPLFAPYRPQKAWHRHPQLWLLVPFVVGLWIGRSAFDILEPRVDWLLGISVILLLVSLILHYSKHLFARRATLVTWMGVVGLCAVLWMMRALQTVTVEWADEPRPYALRVVHLPRHNGRTLALDAEILRGDRIGRTVRVYLPDSLSLHVGDVFWINTAIRLPIHSGNPYSFNWPEYLVTQGISGVTYTRHIALLPDTIAEQSLSQWAVKVQQRAVDVLATHFSDTDFAMLAAMTVGDKSGLTAEVREPFADTGTSHVLALSGLHLGILFGLYNFLLLSRLRRRAYRLVAVAIGLGLIWLFAFVAGLPISLQRAALMFSVAQLMLLRRYDTLGLDRLLWAAFVLLLISPLALYDVGFQLSFFSVGAIMWLRPLLPSLSDTCSRLWHTIYDSIATTFCAFVGTLPLVAYYFHTIGVYTLPANLLVVTLLVPLLGLCLLLFVLPFGTSLWVMCISALLKVITVSLQTLSHLPSSTLTLYPTTLGTCLAILLLFAITIWIYSRTRLSRWFVCLLFVVVLVESIWTAHPHRKESQLVVYNLWQGSAVQLIRRDGGSYLWTHGEGAKDDVQAVARDFWRATHLQEPLSLDSAYRDAYLAFSPPLLAFENKRLALLDDRQSRDSSTIVAADYLIVCKGYSGKPARTLMRYPKATVVLDASLGKGYRRMWQHAADSLHRNVYDVSQQGALIIGL